MCDRPKADTGDFPALHPAPPLQRCAKREENEEKLILSFDSYYPHSFGMSKIPPMDRLLTGFERLHQRTQTVLV